MAKGTNQKMKMLYLMKLFIEKTDQAHYLTMPEIINYLAFHDIEAERKSIYTDIDALNKYGFEINGFQEQGKYYYHLVSGKFELAELKLLVDAVQSSKFITIKKSNELIKKIESFASEYEAHELQRQVFVTNRIKTMNESIYYNVDGIHEAINHNKKISFQYAEWMISKKERLKKDGALYRVSPWALMWANENYYLVSYDSEKSMIKHFRVDKMRSIQVETEARDGSEKFEKFDMGDYAKQTFSMFGGTLERVKLVCDKKLIGVIMDRFGQDSMIMPQGDDHFSVVMDVEVSQQYLAWVIGLGAGAKVVSPENVVEQMRAEAKRLTEQYG